MCGIVGGVNCNIDDIEKMLLKIKHRGPDDSGIKMYDNVILGMNRLAIIDTKKHQIPFENKNFAFVYNGEIFNYKDICSKTNFITTSDMERVLCAYEEKGVESFKELNGMYAFVIYDKKNKELLLVRDKVGKSPLFFTQIEDKFFFASEIKALLEVIEPTLNENIYFNAFEFSVGRETLFKNIYSLLPGEYIKFKNNKIEFYNYYKIEDNLISLPDSETKLINILSELIEDAVLIRTKNRAFNYTTLLSGGIDSSLITAIAKPDIIYTSHYDYDDFDELYYAKLLAKHIKKELKIVTPTKEDFLNNYKDILYYMDNIPTWTSFTLYMLLKQIKNDGFKIVLSGEGADEIFAGYYRYLLIYHEEQIYNVPQMKNYTFLINKYYGQIHKRYAKIINRGDDEALKFLQNLLNDYYISSKDYISFMGKVDFYTTMQILLEMADRLSFANQIESRNPFLDSRIIEFAFSLDKKYKIKDYTTKYLLRKVAQKFIPKEIVNRIDKRGFSAPINKWFNQDGYDRNFYKNFMFKEFKVRYFNEISK